MSRDGVWLGVLTTLLVLTAVWALTVGAAGLSGTEALRALWSGDGERAGLIVQGVRLPRVLAAVAVGATLAVAGAIMQAVTGNPMADPGLLGVNAGAAFAVVLAIAFGGITATGSLVWFAFAGAAGAAVLVYGLGSAGRTGGTPVKLVLAGVVVAGFLGALTMSLLVMDAQTFDVIRMWTAGSLTGRQLPEVLALLPYALAALAGALLLRDQFSSLALGADIASGLGQNQAAWRAVSVVLVVALAGSAVALAGPIGFVGLVVPHLVRLTVSADYRRILPYACLVGAGLMLLADTLPRAVWGRDVPVGITMAMIGAPFFIWLARRRVGEGR